MEKLKKYFKKEQKTKERNKIFKKIYNRFPKVLDFESKVRVKKG